MPTYIALLRAVNVGGRFYTMAALREHLTGSGLSEVETYIQTGNVRFRSAMRSPAKVEAHVESVLGEHCGFDVPSVIFTPAELREVYDDAQHAAPPAFGGGDGVRRFVHLFKAGAAPTGEVADRIAAWDAPGEAAVVTGRAVHIWIDGPMHEAKLFPAFKKPLAPGTGRNLAVLTALTEQWT
ncbi:MAG: DUF1697 domain-containing protein [Nocardioidaceae bacterium]